VPGPKMKSNDHNPEPNPPVLDYAASRSAAGPPQTWWPSVVSMLLALGAMIFLPCMCGHLGGFALAVTLPASGLGCYGWIANKNRDLIWRGFLMFAVVLSAMVLLKNIGDVLWFGHEALLRW
jgi:hypothetical protein